jgi:uncharacterized damage-inducible protein DinB
MTKQYFQELAAYNLWANNSVCEWLNQINDEQWTEKIVSSFDSIQQTVLHIISAEKAWLERFKKNPNIVWLQNQFQGTKDEHIMMWKNTSEDLKKFIDDFDENNLQTDLDFTRLNGKLIRCRITSCLLMSSITLLIIAGNW